MSDNVSGDLWSYNDEFDQYVVSPDPDVDVVELGAKEKSMVLGSDGIWNVIKAQSCADIVNAHEWKELREQGKEEGHPKFLVSLSGMKGHSFSWRAIFSFTIHDLHQKTTGMNESMSRRIDGFRKTKRCA